jgi:hypothetical protein
MLAHEIYDSCHKLYDQMFNLVPKDKIDISTNPEEMVTSVTEHDDRCPICWETDGDDWVKLDVCIHKFHKKCIIPYLQTHHKCPYCMREPQMVDDLYESLIPMNVLLGIFNEKVPLITHNQIFLRLVEIVRTLKYEQFAPVTLPENAMKYYELYKDECLNTYHVFLSQIWDGRYNLTTLVNGYYVNYCDSFEKLTTMSRVVWPDRDIVIILKENSEPLTITHNDCEVIILTESSFFGEFGGDDTGNNMTVTINERDYQ